jgi:hypothetical protein
MFGAARDAAAEAAEDVRRRFGDGAVVPARLLDQPGSLEQEGEVEGR